MAIKKKGGLGKGLDALIPKGEKTEKPADAGVGTANSYLDILKVQPVGKKPMTAQDFLRGHTLNQGELFDNE